MGNGAIKVHAEFHWVQRIAIAMHDERPRRDNPELRRREREIVVARGESAGHLVEAGNLRVSMHMPRAECGALGVRQTVERVLRELRRRRSQRRWKIRRRADEHHRRYNIRTRRGHMQQRFGTHAHADRVGARHAEMIEERQHVLCALAEGERTRRIRRPSMSAQIRHDHSVSVRVFRKHVEPVPADSHTAVQEQQRFSGATVFEVHVKAVHMNC